MTETYMEAMPITTLIQENGRIFLGGGGGNTAFGFPNQVILLSPGKQVLSRRDVKTIVVSAKIYGEYVVVDFGGEYEIYSIKGGKIEGPFPIDTSILSPVIINDSLFYIKNNKVFCSSLYEFLRGEGEEAFISTEHAEDERISSLIVENTKLIYLLEKKQENFLIRNNRKIFLDGPICNYSSDLEFGYIVQLPKENSLITMHSCTSGKEKRWRIIEPKTICIHSLGKGTFIVGTGDGYIVTFKEGREVYRKKISDCPISSVTSIGDMLHCSTINGHYISISKKEGSKIFSLILMASVAAGVAFSLKHLAYDSLCRLAAPLYKMFGWV
ncbi:hypothetical protein NEFER03_2138 [Nematocida sp. LUAm3]|nr:hypothetical protein NEFER03_2138 [Nematocida sp. LUAm3]KAI5174609.1 hypothetical protein NEFER02_0730 [Nematocida sp. LUAm2]KAI5177985.1 hypothetical protein NEFER01_1167 [Nematocida sp. LUAm1]